MVEVETICLDVVQQMKSIGAKDVEVLTHQALAIPTLSHRTGLRRETSNTLQGDEDDDHRCNADGNWYFIGSEDATDWAATNFTIFESCRLAKVDPRAWLRHVTARIHAGDTDYATMTPAACTETCPARA